jgi:hypothetical protein
VMGVAREIGRLIRLSYNGHITVSELTGHVFALDKLRACLESAIAIEANAIANAPKPAPPAVRINILTVPSGTYVNEATMQRINENVDSFPRRSLIEPMEPTSEPTASSLEPPAEVETGPSDAQSADDGLDALSVTELMQRAEQLACRLRAN